MLLYLAVVITFMLAIYAFVWVKSNQEDELGKFNTFLYIVSIVPLTALTWAAFRKDVGHTAWMKNPR
jgi:hypothetical protein